jgi:hypothetical protein
MKYVAFYLPQFHEIKENNAWWEDGFTEWTNVKRAKPLFRGHRQPREPENDNYYDLMDKETVEWQTSLAKKYGISAFCYFHYWFSERKLLEKPAENFLAWKDIDHEFCFCWANHSWKKTWDGTQSLLMEQTYGGEGEWVAHLEYLLPFFRDPRYLRAEDKPVFVVYSIKDVEDYQKRFAFYDAYLKARGLGGIYLIEVMRRLEDGKVCVQSDAVLLRQPDLSFAYSGLAKRALNKLNRTFLKRISFFSYSTVWRRAIKLYKKCSARLNAIPCAFFDWDNTSRHARRGTVLRGASPEAFRHWLGELLTVGNGDLLFVNAWNEWCEGMHLEPDKKYGAGYLEALKEMKDLHG